MLSSLFWQFVSKVKPACALEKNVLTGSAKLIRKGWLTSVADHNEEDQ